MSNGHGEDLSGSIIGTHLIKLGHEVESLPIVGLGKAYSKVGITNIFNLREFSTGGLGYTTFYGRITEIFQGQIFYLFHILIHLKLVSRRYDFLIIIGDVVPIIAAWIARRPSFAYLVAYSSHYEGNLKLPWPCLACLKSKCFLRVYSRDKLTQIHLNKALINKTDFLGNPFMEPLFNSKLEYFSSIDRLGILPGSRRPELDDNLLLILRGIEVSLYEGLDFKNLSIDFALVSSYDSSSLNRLAYKFNSQINKSSSNPLLQYFYIKGLRINIYRNSFATILKSSDVLLSMSGTAAEQAVGLSKLVVQLPGRGPQFTPSFAEAQRRLLGPTVFCANGKAGSRENLLNTFHLILTLIKKAKYDRKLILEAQTYARDRLGGKDGGKLIAKSIDSLIISKLRLK